MSIYMYGIHFEPLTADEHRYFARNLYDTRLRFCIAVRKGIHCGPTMHTLKASKLQAFFRIAFSRQ
jgi:hypothetical protein